MQEETTNAPMTTVANRMGLLGANQLAGPTPASPLQDALNEHANQLGKLHDLINTLAERLTPLRNMQSRSADDTQAGSPSSSAVVEQLFNKTEEVKYLQGRISELLDDLEV